MCFFERESNIYSVLNPEDISFKSASQMVILCLYTDLYQIATLSLFFCLLACFVTKYFVIILFSTCINIKFSGTVFLSTTPYKLYYGVFSNCI